MTGFYLKWQHTIRKKMWICQTFLCHISLHTIGLSNSKIKLLLSYDTIEKINCKNSWHKLLSLWSHLYSLASDSLETRFDILYWAMTATHFALEESFPCTEVICIYKCMCSTQVSICQKFSPVEKIDTIGMYYLVSSSVPDNFMKN